MPHNYPFDAEKSIKNENLYLFYKLVPRKVIKPISKRYRHCPKRFKLSYSFNNRDVLLNKWDGDGCMINDQL